MSIWLPRQETVELYCYCREAERSVHRLLNPANSMACFLAYYDRAKVDAIQRLRDWLASHLSGIDLATPVRIESDRRLGRGPSFWQVLFGRLGAPWKRRLRFLAIDLAYITQGLDRFLALLQANEKPNPDELISVRMQLCDCEGIIESRGYGLTDWRKACFIRHFDSSDAPVWKTISEILHKAA